MRNDGADDAEVIANGEAMPLGKAKALKETYLARLRRLEFEAKSGRLVDADAAKKAVSTSRVRIAIAGRTGRLAFRR